MRGIFSSSPAPGAVRVLLGGHLLLLVAANLVLAGASAAGCAIVPLLLCLVCAGITALIIAIVGEPADDPTSAREGRRNG